MARHPDRTRSAAQAVRDVLTRDYAKYIPTPPQRSLVRLREIGSLRVRVSVRMMDAVKPNRDAFDSFMQKQVRKVTRAMLERE